MRTSVLVLDSKAQKNRPLASTEEVWYPHSFLKYRVLTHYGVRDLSFLLLL